MTADPTYVAMLKTPEARSVWEQVLEMRGWQGATVIWDSVEERFHCDARRESVGWTRFTVRPPDLGELWALAKEKGLPLRISWHPIYGPREAVHLQYEDSRDGWIKVSGKLTFQAVLLSYIVGREWDAERGKWKEKP